jgi:EF-P beta-lysylation protein EpmB
VSTVAARPALDAGTDWHRSLARAVRCPEELIRRLELPDRLLPAARRAAREFPLMVTESYLDRIQAGDLHDPLLRQILPLASETETHPEFSRDAVGDTAARIAPGLIHKYRGRALLIATGTCAIHCRYCFRRHYDYQQDPRQLDAWQPALRLLRADTSLQELILSGGDPLMLVDRRLRDLIGLIEDIPHIKRLRIHTRLPIVLPERIDDTLQTVLREHRLQTVVVVHANHARELSGDCADALTRLADSSHLLFNQAVLLHKVNDTADAQVELCERLLDLRVIPYYLHQLDRVEGGQHFEVSDARARKIMAEMRCRLPGYAVPRLVREVAGAAHKVPLM